MSKRPISEYLNIAAAAACVFGFAAILFVGGASGGVTKGGVLAGLICLAFFAIIVAGYVVRILHRSPGAQNQTKRVAEAHYTIIIEGEAARSPKSASKSFRERGSSKPPIL